MDVQKRITDKVNQWKVKRELAIKLLGGEAPVKAKIKEFTLKANSLKEMRIACIMDEFTYFCYAPECSLRELTPEGWKDEIDVFSPDLLFIESAWKGKAELWHRKVDRYSQEMYELTEYCRSKGIPIIFWNKEDPGFTDSFMTTASFADFVFTTDIDCIPIYKKELNHDRVYHLHFAAQPKLHNPIEKYERKDKFCFAGAYYHKYVKRCETFDKFARVFIDTKGFDIYDRNYPSPLPEHAFPDIYDPYILGRLEPADIDVAYKGYTYGVNMNSSPQSQTMLARRAFELMASNTVCVGNYSRAMKNYFGDLTICTDDEHTLGIELQTYSGSREKLRKYRLLGLRKVTSGHLYEDRLAYVIEKVFGRNLKTPLPSITVFARPADEDEAGRIRACFGAQGYVNKSLVLLSDSDKNKTLAELAEGEYVAFFSPSDWYGENFLTDLILSVRYGSFDAIGKAAYYMLSEKGSELINPCSVYTIVPSLDARRSVARLDKVGSTKANMLIEGLQWKLNNMLSADEFNYCENAKGEVCREAADILLADRGISIHDLNTYAEKIEPMPNDPNVLEIKTKEIAEIKAVGRILVKITFAGGKAVITSELPEGKHEYVFLEKLYNITPYIQEGKLPVRFAGHGMLDVICTCIFYSRKKKKLDPQYTYLGRLEQLTPPEGAVFVKFGFRVKGKGNSELEYIKLGESKLKTGDGTYLARSDVLVLTNHYPSREDLYRNMFVHQRMKSYKESGRSFELMRMHPYAARLFREFEGINITEGHTPRLASILDSGKIKTVCVHFLDASMWAVLKNYLGEIRLIIWSHGADIQPWWRRTFNYSNDMELERAKADSIKIMALWSEVFKASADHNIHFVYVSNYFANEVMEDYKVKIPADKYSIIHNCIDTELFIYIPKDAEQRKRIFTVKPFASMKYANDITAKAIVALAETTEFKDMEFHIYGDGDMFDKDNAPLRKYPNVHLNKRFLTQSEIAEIHKTCGIYIATTRWDSHGVSRDEAMASGLVPVASNVAAIPEFVDETCGILVPGEDWQAVADAILRLYRDPDLFARLSENAAARVRSQSSKKHTIDKEFELIVNNLKNI